MAGTGREVLTGGKAPKVRKARVVWTKAKKAAFLAALAESCNVRLALRRVRMKRTSLYDERRRCAAFRAGWAEAIREGYARLELELLDRAMNGTVKTVVRSDGRSETVKEYPNAVALSLLRMHRDKAESAEREYDPEEIEEVRERILKKLEVVRKRRDAGEE